MAPEHRAVPVLMYHEVTEASRIDELARLTQRNYILTRERFAEHLDALAAAGASTISLGQLRAWQRGDASLPERAVVITFDDGYAGNLQHALPLLERHRFTATFFVVTDLVGSLHMLSWEQLAELGSRGMAVESHSVTHPLLSTVGRARTLAELSDSRRILEDRLGRPVVHFSMPHGDTNEYYEEAMQQAGYDSGCCSELGFNEPATDRFRLRRIAMTSGTSSEQLVRLAECDCELLARMRGRAKLKRTLARLLGKQNYSRLVNLYYGVGNGQGDRAP